MSSHTSTEPAELTGQTWLVTGATGGLGQATARAAAAAGARVILGVRNRDRGAALAADLPGADVLQLDLSRMQSVRAAAAEVGEIDVLVNNAGVSSDRRIETEDGFELDLATNALGPFLFTELVRDRVRRRIVVVGSAPMVYENVSFDFSDPHFQHRPWTKSAAYAESKLAMMLWATESARRAADAGHGADVQLTYPGWAGTDMANPTSLAWLDRPMAAIARTVGNSPAQGARNTVYAATRTLPPGSYIGPDGWRGLRGAPTRLDPPAVLGDERLARRLWEFAAAATASRA